MRDYRVTGFLLSGLLVLSVWITVQPAFSEPGRSDHSLTPGVPFFPQEKLGCGPAALASLLSYWGFPVSLEEITREVYLPKLKGSLPLDLELAARRRDLEVRSYSGGLDDLRLRLSRDQPVIVFLNLGWRQFPQGHFIVVTGYDDTNEAVIAHTGLHPNQRIEHRTFLKAWAKTDYWTLLIHPKETT